MAEVYRILYTEPALADLEEKARYITEKLQAPDTAERWYLRLRAEIQENLAVFPRKYALYPVEKWRAKGIRLVTFRRDVVLYSVDEEERTVCIRAVCTKGQDLSAHMDEQT